MTKWGGSAFPVMEPYLNPGMTLRDYFAAAALQGMLANGRTPMSHESHARAAYLLADAMLRERGGE